MVPEILRVLLAVIGVVVSLATARQARHLTPDKPDSEQPSMTARIEALRENLALSATILDEIHTELQVRTTALEQVRAEAEENQRLADLNADAAAAVKSLLARTIEAAQEEASKRDSKKQRLYFVSGLALAVPLAVVANFLYAFMTQ
ncbi:hypothetical protein ACVH9Z_34350 [Rhodococcus opacus]|uniref:hypothetical protein n=1 Tax=Rhodococcus opacus TaxID=37919 RepID=UPI001B31567F|nr:hypothetical protein [Rhodococcus opacus]